MFMFPTAEQYEKKTNIPGIRFSFFQDPKSTAVRQSAACREVSAEGGTANGSITQNNKSPPRSLFLSPVPSAMKQ